MVIQSRWAEYEEGEGYVEIGEQIIDIDNRTEEEYIGVLIEQDTTTSSEAECIALVPDAFTDQIQTSLGTHQGSNGQRTEGDFRYTEYDDDNETAWRGEPGYGYDPDTDQCLTGWFIYEYFADVTFEIIEELQPDGTITFAQWIYDEFDTANPPGGSNPAGSPAGWANVDITTAYSGSNQVTVPLGSNGGNTTLTWDGCVEEADTVATTNFDPIPAGALDMNINLVPSTEAERWKPVIRNIAWERRNGDGISGTTSTSTNNGNRTLLAVAEDERVNANGVTLNQSRPSYSCPKEAFRLTDISRTDLESYVNSLQGRSNTYHDIGMLWGARFISPNGIFASENAAAPNGDAIARHIVFMTDGILAPNREVYGTYGIEWWGRRVSGNANNNTLSTAHAERFQAACRLARQENISVWVVAFGTELTSNLSDCATPGRAFVADDSTELADTFEEIAQRIAALRLTQ